MIKYLFFWGYKIVGGVETVLLVIQAFKKPYLRISYRKMSWLKFVFKVKRILINPLAGGLAILFICTCLYLTFWKKYGHEKYFSSLPCLLKKVLFKNICLYDIYKALHPLVLKSLRTHIAYLPLDLMSCPRKQ